MYEGSQLPLKRGLTWPTGPSTPGLVWGQAHPLLTARALEARSRRDWRCCGSETAGSDGQADALAVPEKMLTTWQAWRRLKRVTEGERELETGEGVGRRGTGDGRELNWGAGEERESRTARGERRGREIVLGTEKQLRWPGEPMACARPADHCALARSPKACLLRDGQRRETTRGARRSAILIFQAIAAGSGRSYLLPSTQPARWYEVHAGWQSRRCTPPRTLPYRSALVVAGVIPRPRRRRRRAMIATSPSRRGDCLISHIRKWQAPWHQRVLPSRQERR